MPTKIEVKNRFTVFVSSPCEKLYDDVQAVAEGALDLPAVLEDEDGLELQVRQQAVDTFRTQW